MAGRFEYSQAREIAAAFGRCDVRYLFIGKSGAVILGFPDTTQDADLFLEKSPENGRAAVRALAALGFELTEAERSEIERGKALVQLRQGPFDLDLVFAPDGIETFAEAHARSVVVDGLPVCHIDDIIRSKEATGRLKDRESLPRLKAFRDWLLARGREPWERPWPATRRPHAGACGRRLPRDYSPQVVTHGKGQGPGQGMQHSCPGPHAPAAALAASIEVPFTSASAALPPKRHIAVRTEIVLFMSYLR